MFKGLAFLALASAMALTVNARAADKPRYAAPGAWVKAVPIPDKAAGADGAATQFLLQNDQFRFGPEGDQSYQEYAVKILTPQGLGAVGNFILPWNPDTDTLTIHRLNVIRDGKVIDLLDGGKNVTVLRRETNLELSMLDGDLTATIQPEGLQVGDVIDVAYTMLSRDPVLHDHSVGFTQLVRPGIVTRAYVRALWPKAKPIRWRITDGMPKPAVTATAQDQELLIDQANAEAPKPPTGAPGRFNNLAQIEFSQFADWTEISAMMAPLYAKAATLAPGSPLKAEIQTIAAASTDPKARATAALKLVEDKVRYVLLAMNNGGYIPADVDLTWTRRFGDCKGKTALLLALLKGLGIDAEPVLVNSHGADGLDEHLPLFAFDHVLVRARIGGRTYWLDGTRQGDRNLDNLPIPNYRWVLPVTAAGAALENVTPPPYETPHFESIVRLDARAGLDAPAPAHAEHIFRGDEGLGMHLLLAQAGRTDVDQALKQYWRGKISWIDPKTASFTYDEATATTTLIMDGSATIDWAKNQGVRDFNVYDSSLGYQANFDREPGPNRDAPYTVAYPHYSEWTVIVTLPDKGEGFSFLNPYQDKTLAGVRYRRASTLNTEGVATITASDQALEPEFPASQAKTDAVALSELSNYVGAIRFGDRPEAALATQCSSQDADLAIRGCTALIAKTGMPPATQGEIYMARSAAYIRQGKLDLAIADETRAIALQPSQRAAYLARAQLYGAHKQYDLGVRDMDLLLGRDANDAEAHRVRGVLYQQEGQLNRALQDFDEAIRLAPDDINNLIARGSAHVANHQPELAVADGELAVKSHPNSPLAYESRERSYAAAHQWDLAIADADKVAQFAPNNAGVLNGQCWTRAEANKDLDQALVFCEAALKLSPASAGITDSRGFVHFRQGRMKDALADYDQALKLSAKQPSSLFMRGVIKHRLGDAAGGEADIAAAKVIDPKIVDTYAALGVAP